MERFHKSTMDPVNTAIECLNAIHPGVSNRMALFEAKSPHLSLSEQSHVLVQAMYACKPHTAENLHTLLDAGWVVAPEDSHAFISSLLRSAPHNALPVVDKYWNHLVDHGLNINQQHNNGSINLLISNATWPTNTMWLLHHGADPTRKLSRTGLDAMQTVQVTLDEVPHEHRHYPFYQGKLKSLHMMMREHERAH